jgi:hypothetical protein
LGCFRVLIPRRRRCFPIRRQVFHFLYRVFFADPLQIAPLLGVEERTNAARSSTLGV